MSLETMAWLLTEAVQTLETKVMAAIDAEDMQAAVDALGRSMQVSAVSAAAGDKRLVGIFSSGKEC